MPLRKDINKVLVIGSGPIVIGQAAEFDYAGTQACLALKEEGLQVVLVNSNPATIMTDQKMADEVYIEPLTAESIEKIIAKERPDGVIGTLGGQTGLNLAVELQEQGILDRYGVELFGTSVESIQKGEDREKFRQLMMDINEPIPESKIITSVEAGLAFAREIGYPLISRPAYTLGGSGGGFAYNEQELEQLLKKGLRLSPIHQVLVEKSIKGWKEVEYEVMRDANDTCIIVCNMENLDPVGVHTGDSIVVAPSQTLTDVQYQMLRQASLKVIRALDIIGGCNIQFALDPDSDEYVIIEVNPRVSRSSALASKATGYPIARMAAKCAVGYHLDEILNPITGNTYASFEPAIDYIVVKLPRFAFDKFAEADRSLGTQMKATGEVMAIERHFEGALNKGLRSLEMNVHGLRLNRLNQASDAEIHAYVDEATDIRLFAIAEALRRGVSVESIHTRTKIDRWFLYKLANMVRLEHQLQEHRWPDVPEHLLKQVKQQNMSDAYVAQLFGIDEKDVRDRYKASAMQVGYKLVDTCAAEFEAVTPYYYSTWSGTDEAETNDRRKILVVGSGPIRIGQGVEFDYCSVHATQAVKKKGFEAIVMNNNPETVSTDYSIADRLYFEPLTVQDILAVIEKEQVQGVLVQFGGQTAINVAEELEAEGVRVLGTSIQAIDNLEDRQRFYELLTRLDIPHISGRMVHHTAELKKNAIQLGFPVLVRPSYVIGGQSMFIFYDESELDAYVEELERTNDDRLWPLLVDRYMKGKECEVDVISDGQNIVIPGVFEHVEKAGVHSGDSVAAFPAWSLDAQLTDTLTDYAERIARDAPIVGIMNIQFVIAEGTVYVLEVNPRASRTVPIMSKVTGIPMVDWATHVQLGTPLTDVCSQTGLLDPPDFYSVKVPVFSANKLHEVDHVLGPEMKSTGELLGLGTSKEEALSKSLFYGQRNPFNYTGEKPVIVCSIAEREKEEALAMFQEFIQRGFQLLATDGTACVLAENGISCERLSKDRSEMNERLKQSDIAAVVNIPNQGRVKSRSGFYLRELAVRHGIPCFTCLDTVEAALALPDQVEWHIRSMNEYLQCKAERV